MKRMIEMRQTENRRAAEAMQREANADAQRAAEEAMQREAEARREAEEAIRALQAELVAERERTAAALQRATAQRERLARAPRRIDQATIIDAAIRFMIQEHGLSERIRDLDFAIDRLDEADKMFMLAGDVQGGKTPTMLGYIMSCIAQKRKAIILTCNSTQDRNQVMKSAQEMLSALQEHLYQELGDDYLHCNVYDIDGVENWARSPRQTDIIVVMANVSQLKKLRDSIVDHNIRPMMAVDESDATMNIKATAKDVDVSKLVKECYDLAHVVMLVSATHFATWFTEGSLTSHYISITTHPNYKGIESLIHVPLPERNKRANADIFVQSRDLPDFLNDLANQAPFDIDHPIIGLAKVSNLISHHNQILNAIRDSDVWGPKFATVIFNGEGTTLYHDSLRGLDELVLPRHKRGDIANVGVRVGDGVFQFKDANLKKVLSYMRTHGGIERFPRIVIIAGNLARRAQNFTDMDYEWHVTAQMIDIAVSATVVDAIQSLRILGIHKNPTELKLYTTLKTYTDIQKAHTHVQKFIVEAAANNPDQTFLDMCSQIKMHRDKMPGRTICGKRKPFRCVANERDDNTASFLNVSEPVPEISVDATPLDDSSIKWIDETRIPVDTQAFTVFSQAKQILLDNYGTGEWIERAEVLRRLPGGRPQNEARLKDVFQQRFNRRVIEETTGGFLMKKQNGVMHFRIN